MSKRQSSLNLRFPLVTVIATIGKIYGCSCMPVLVHTCVEREVSLSSEDILQRGLIRPLELQSLHARGSFFFFFTRATTRFMVSACAKKEQVKLFTSRASRDKWRVFGTQTHNMSVYGTKFTVGNSFTSLRGKVFMRKCNFLKSMVLIKIPLSWFKPILMLSIVVILHNIFGNCPL